MSITWYIIALGIFLYLVYDTYKEGGWREAAKFAVIFAALFFLIRGLIVQPFLVEGPSMEPTFQTGNYLLVDKFSYKFLRSPERGDVVVFDIPDQKHTFHVCLLNLFDTCYFQTNRYLIKRIIGLPGEKVVIVAGVVTIYNKDNPNGLILDEKEIQFKSDMSDERVLNENEYYVMGDNRANSMDSRIFGPVPKENIVGSPILRLTPLSEIGIWPGSI